MKEKRKRDRLILGKRKGVKEDSVWNSLSLSIEQDGTEGSW
jgi:hypothetical protein